MHRKEESWNENVILYIVVGVIISVIAWYLISGNPDLRVNIHYTEDNMIDFSVSNNRDGVAIVNNIELIASNFSQVDGCKDYLIMHAPMTIYSFGRISIKPEYAAYNLDKFKEEGIYAGEEYWSVNNNLLSYSEGEVDHFRVHYDIASNRSHSLCLTVKVYWCNPKYCNILEEKKQESNTVCIVEKVQCPFNKTVQ